MVRECQFYAIFVLTLMESLTSSPYLNDTCNSEPWIEIFSPTPAQLFLEGDFTNIFLKFRVHGFKMDGSSGVANVHVIKHAMSYGGDPFRGREDLRNSPQHQVYEETATLQLVFPRDSRR